MEAHARDMMLLRAAMNVKTGLMCPPERGTVTMRKRKAIDVVNVNISEAVATNSVSAAFHI